MKVDDFLRAPRVGCISDLSAELYLCGGLGGPKKEEVEAHLAGCAACSARLGAMKESVAGIRLDPARIVERAASEKLLRRFSGMLSGTFRRPAILLPVAAAVALLVAVPVLVHNGGRVGTVREKGGVDLSFFVRMGDGSRPGVSGETLRAGDAVKFAVNPGENTHVMIVDIEEGGSVSRFYPRTDGSAPVERNRTSLLPVSITLDRYRGSERIIAIFSKTSVSFGEVSRAVGDMARDGKLDLKSLEALPLPYPQASIVIFKE